MAIGQAKCIKCGGETIYRWVGYSERLARFGGSNRNSPEFWPYCESCWTGDKPAEPTRQPFQQRVIDEKRELDEKVAKLQTFTTSAAFEMLPWEERARMLRQHMYMVGYSQVLRERIAAFD